MSTTKLALGASGIFYFLVGITFLVFFFLFPYPHYSLIDNSWYMGASIGARLTGVPDGGVPLEKVFEKVTTATVTSPLDISCVTNADCKAYTVISQCMVYCGNTNSSNDMALMKLNNNRVCDPATWRKPVVNCTCVHGNCVDLE